jgi:hypothetical protein
MSGNNKLTFAEFLATSHLKPSTQKCYLSSIKNPNNKSYGTAKYWWDMWQKNYPEEESKAEAVLEETPPPAPLSVTPLSVSDLISTMVETKHFRNINKLLKMNVSERQRLILIQTYCESSLQEIDDD